MKGIIERLGNSFDRFMLDEGLRKRNQLILISVILFFVSIVMFMLNVFSNQRGLMTATGVFSLVALFSIYIVLVHKLNNIAELILSASLLVMFTSFLLNGGINGFSPIWLMILPGTAVSLFGLKRGSTVSCIMLLIIVLLLWTPESKYLSYNYSAAFRTRFPIVYISSFILAFALEAERCLTHMRLMESRRKLEEISRIDELTQLENRRSFNIRLNELWDLVVRANAVISILMIDIDYFKQYNDSYGHLKGDKVLKEVADTIVGSVSRKNDFVARWGGEEFVVLLPLTDAEGAQVVAQNIIAAVNDKKIPHAFSGLNKKYITISIGIASLHPDREDSSQKLLELGDRSLYCAKERGRDTIGPYIN